jgi:diaminopimelate epimerase
MQFVRYHALGNVYIVLPDAPELTAAQVQRLCHDRFGLASDGLLLPGERASPRLSIGSAEFPLSILNPDGSSAETSGNGLRIFSRWLWDTGQVSTEPFTINTGYKTVRAQILADGQRIAVEMGQAVVESFEHVLEVDGQTVSANIVSMGNPHCVVVGEIVSAETAHRLGPLIENHPHFPNRTNVQFAEPINRNAIRIEIWERGAGYTLASGSSACAAAVIAHRLGWCDVTIAVHMLGGVLDVQIAPDGSVAQTGPVVKVAEGFVTSAVLSTSSAEIYIHSSGG